jgi:hypothetical protein
VAAGGKSAGADVVPNIHSTPKKLQQHSPLPIIAVGGRAAAAPRLIDLCNHHRLAILGATLPQSVTSRCSTTTAAADAAANTETCRVKVVAVKRFQTGLGAIGLQTTATFSNDTE